MATKKRGAPKSLAPPKVERRQRRTMSQSDMLEFWTDKGFLIPHRVIYLGSSTTDVDGGESGVDAAMAKNFEVGMRSLEYFDPKGPINVVMNNLGGDWYHGMAIYDRIMDSPCHVTIRATGYVMSMGSIILQAADRRLLSRNATLMTHPGSDGFIGHAHDFARAAKENERIQGEMTQIYFDRMLEKDSTVTVEKVRHMLQFDTYMDALRAIRLGLADGLVPRPKHRRVKQNPAPAKSTPPESEST